MARITTIKTNKNYSDDCYCQNIIGNRERFNRKHEP